MNDIEAAKLNPLMLPFLGSLWQVLTLFTGFILGIYVAVFLHECGHALGSVLNGDRVYAVVMEIPAPAGHVQASSPSWMGTWGGVFFGSLFSLPPMLLARLLPAKSISRYAALMVASLCLAHNGLYLCVGSITPFADAAGMIDYGAPKWLLFPLGVPLLAGFVIVMSHAIAMVGQGPPRSLWKSIVTAELGMLPLPALAVVATLVTPGQQHGATTLPMALWAATYGAGFALATCRAWSAAQNPTATTEGRLLPQRWHVPATLCAWALLVILVEWLISRPVVRG